MSNQHPQRASGESVAWISEPTELDAHLAAWPAPLVLAADTEFIRRSTFFPHLALLQLAAGDGCVLVDPLACAASDGLRQRLEDAASVCIMHSAGEDLEALADWLPHGPRHLFDSQIAADMAGMGAGLSYHALVLAVTGVDLPKGETCSDWMQRPLSAAQREYAVQDVAHLHAIHDHLHATLAARGRLAWLDDDGQRLCQRAQRDRLDPQPQLAVRAAGNLSHPDQARLRRLLLWRERLARELDTPRPWLLDNKLALALVSDPPTTAGALFEHVRGHRSLRSEPRRELLALLQQPLDDADIEATQPVPPPLRAGDRQKLKTLKHAVDTLAAELDLSAGLLCPRRRLEDLLATGSWPTALDGWRRVLLEPRLAPLLD